MPLSGMAWHGVTAPVDIGGLIGPFQQRPVCLPEVGMPPSPVALQTVRQRPKSFLVNGRLSTLTFQRHLREAAIFYPPRLALSTPQRVNFIAARLVMMQRAGVTREVRVSGEHERERE